MTEDEIGRVVVDASLEVHRGIGPGLFESVYEAVLAYELRGRGLEVQQQVAIPIRYKGRLFEHGFRADLLIESKVLIELKSVDVISALHRKQVLTYLRLGDLKLGFLINFNVGLLENGVERFVNRLPE